jgi:hypothetical protein
MIAEEEEVSFLGNPLKSSGSKQITFASDYT